MFICKILENRNPLPLPTIENYKSYSIYKSAIDFSYNPACGILEIGQTEDYFSILLGNIFNINDLCEDVQNKEFLSPALKLIVLKQRHAKDLPSLLKGSFIFIIINKKDNSVFMAKSPLNKKQLFFSCKNSILYLSTSVPLIKKSVPHIFDIKEERVIDLQARAAKISDKTFYNGIEQIEGGSTIEIHKCSDVLRRYYFSTQERTENKSNLNYADGLNTALNNAITRNIKPEDKILCEISGGLDSSSIAARLAKNRKNLTCISNYSTEASLIEIGTDPRKANEIQLKDFESMYQNTKIIKIDERSISHGYQDITRFCFENSSGPEYGITNVLWIYAFYMEAHRNGFTKIINGLFGDDAYSYSHTGPSFKGIVSSAEPVFSKIIRGTIRQLKAERNVIFPYLREPIKKKIRKESLLNSVRRNRSDRLQHANFSINSCTSIDTALFNSLNIESVDILADHEIIECCLSIPESAFHHGVTNRYITRIANKEILPESIRSNFIKGAQSPRWHVQLRKELPYYFSLLQKFKKNDLIKKLIDLEQLEKCMAHFTIVPENTIKNYSEMMWLPCTLHICEWISLHD